MATAELIQSLTNVRAEAEEMLQRHVADNPEANGETLVDLLTPDQRYLLNLAGFETPQNVSMEVGRSRVVHELKNQAGTSRSRKAAEKSAVEAEAQLRTEEVAIRAAIAEAEASLRKLQAAARERRAKADVMAGAVAELQTDRYLPKHVVEQAAYARKRVKASGNAERLRELDSKIGALRATVDTDASVSADSRLEFAKLHAPDTVDKTVGTDGHVSHSLNVAKWSAHIDKCKADLAEMTPLADELRAKVDAELSRCEGCRDFYVSQVN